MTRCWVCPGMKLQMVNDRGHSITVIGAISEKRGLVHYHVINESNNANHFEDFLIGLNQKCQGRRVLIVLDNLRIHYAKKIQYIYDKGFKVMYLPTYSSELNPIERLWSLLKRRWCQSLQLHVEEL